MAGLPPTSPRKLRRPLPLGGGISCVRLIRHFDRKLGRLVISLHFSAKGKTVSQGLFFGGRRVGRRVYGPFKYPTSPSPAFSLLRAAAPLSSGI